MKMWMRGTVALLIGLALIVSIPTGCGNSGDGGLSLKDIPRYPNATEGESIAQSSPGGLVGGELHQFATNDSFDKVVAFYADALDGFDPEVLSHTSELGRQMAFSMPQKNGVLTVAIQAFVEEGTVAITVMSVGK